MASTESQMGDLVPTKRRIENKENIKINLGGQTPESKRVRLAPSIIRKEKEPTKEEGRIKELQDQIDLECLIRDGTVKLLQASAGGKQAMDASKTLFVCNTKILALMNEIQKHRSGQTERPLHMKTNNRNPCPAKIALSNITIPLEWREFESLRGKVDPSTTFNVFCLVKMGHEVCDTTSLVEINKTTSEIQFKDVIEFDNLVEQDFSVQIEVYRALPNIEDHSSQKISTPVKSVFRKFRKDHSDSPHTSSGVSLTGSHSHSLTTNTISPTHRFAIAGHTILDIKDLKGAVHTYPLKKGVIGSSGTAATRCDDGPLLPLWGQFSCHLMAQPECALEPRIVGFINVQQMISNLPNWVRLWAILRQNTLRCWTYPEDVGKKMPVYGFTLTQNMVVENAPRLAIRRPNTVILRDENQESYIAFEFKEERIEWMENFHQSIVDLKVWGSSCEFIIPSSKSGKGKKLIVHRPAPPPPAEQLEPLDQTSLTERKSLPPKPTPPSLVRNSLSRTAHPILPEKKEPPTRPAPPPPKEKQNPAPPPPKEKQNPAPPPKQVQGSRLANAKKTPLVLQLDGEDAICRSNETLL